MGDALLESDRQGKCPRCMQEKVEFFDQYDGYKLSCRNCGYRVNSERRYRFDLKVSGIKSRIVDLILY